MRLFSILFCSKNCGQELPALTKLGRLKSLNKDTKIKVTIVAGVVRVPIIIQETQTLKLFWQIIIEGK